MTLCSKTEDGYGVGCGVERDVEREFIMVGEVCGQEILHIGMCTGGRGG